MTSADSTPLRIAVIPGDGIGRRSSRRRSACWTASPSTQGPLLVQLHQFSWGSSYYLQTGRMMDEDGLEKLQDKDAIFFGAVGWPDVPDHISLWGLRLAICQGFDQYA